ARLSRDDQGGCPDEAGGRPAERRPLPALRPPRGPPRERDPVRAPATRAGSLPAPTPRPPAPRFAGRAGTEQSESTQSPDPEPRCLERRRVPVWRRLTSAHDPRLGPKTSALRPSRDEGARHPCGKSSVEGPWRKDADDRPNLILAIYDVCPVAHVTSPTSRKNRVSFPRPCPFPPANKLVLTKSSPPPAAP